MLNLEYSLFRINVFEKMYFTILYNYLCKKKKAKIIITKNKNEKKNSCRQLENEQDT
jgi:hypothetical protein